MECLSELPATANRIYRNARLSRNDQAPGMDRQASELLASIKSTGTAYFQVGLACTPHSRQDLTG